MSMITNSIPQHLSASSLGRGSSGSPSLCSRRKSAFGAAIGLARTLLLALLVAGSRLPERLQRLCQPRLHDRHLRAEPLRRLSRDGVPLASPRLRRLQTVAAVFAKFCEERLGILWRGWLTSHLIDKYLRNRSYHRLMSRSDIDNPDQRMTEDVKTFTTITLSFLLMLLDSTITAIAFSARPSG